MAHSVADALEVLGLSADQASSRALLRKSYRAAVLKHHPDKNPGDPDAAARFRAACAAYSVLEKRATGGGSADVELSEAARRGADSALDCDPINLKALFRRARALLAIGGPQELTMALDDIKQYQSKGGVLSAMDAGLLVTSEGKPLLPHAVRREPPQSEAKKSPPPPPLESDAEWNQKVADFKEQTRELVAGAAAEAKVDGEEVDAATQAEKKEEAIRAAQERGRDVHTA